MLYLGEQARELIRPGQKPRGQHLFPIIEDNDHLLGVVSRNHLTQMYEEAAAAASSIALHETALHEPVVAYADEPLKIVVHRMVESGFTRMPVVANDGSNRLLGMISLQDLLQARSRNLEEERARERVLKLRMPYLRRVPETRTTV